MSRRAKPSAEQQSKKGGGLGRGKIARCRSRTGMSVDRMENVMISEFLLLALLSQPQSNEGAVPEPNVQATTEQGQDPAPAEAKEEKMICRIPMSMGTRSVRPKPICRPAKKKEGTKAVQSR